ncbi:hypothetical protein [Cellvibrio mixtus]|uniref:hypothetical protein n=1 Tax=Cellvibrio mixtus TaxID=39650 RepID=UPI000587FA87|nr:hypothetical protein [Cellvibrio mixtus]
MKTIKAALGIGVRRASQRKQSGVATILVILMVGVGLVAVSVGTMHTMRNTQERQLVAHSQINAQAGAWAAVETVRQLLGTLTADQLAGLVIDNEWTISGVGVNGLTQKAVVKAVVPPAASKTDYKIRVLVSAVAEAGQSSSTVEVVYEVVPGAAADPFELTGVLDFYNDLEMSGHMDLKSPDAGLSFNVDGDFNATSLSIGGSGLKKMAVTGNITVGSDIRVEELWAKNVTIVGGASATKVFAFGDPDATDDTCCGNVKMTGGTGVTQINANGSVDSGGSGVDEINARRNISITRGGSNHKRLTAGGTVTNTSGGNITEFIKSIGDVTLSGVTMTGSPGVVSKGNVTNSGSATVNKITALGGVTVHSNGTVNNIKSGGNVSLNNVDTKNVEAVGDITCPPGVSTIYENLKAGGTIKDCKPTWDTTPKPTWFQKAKVDMPVVDITIPDKIPKVKLDQPKVNAWLLRSQANYALEINADGVPQVTVKSVHDVADGTYFLRPVSGSDTDREFLCKTLTADRKLCAAKSPSTPVHAFCYGESDKNSCISFTVADGTSIDAKGEKIRDKFIIGGKTLVPGVVWIKGDVVLNNGTYYNTIIATGDVSTSGTVVSYALNYAAAYEKLDSGVSKNAVCKLEYANTAAAAAFSGQYPTNYCVEGKYVSNPVGNIGILAGGYNPADADIYTGGYINLAASNAIYGTIVSGNILETGGSTHVYGYISAAGLKQNEDEKNKLTQSTTVDLTNLPEGYDPTKIPDMSGGSSGATAKSEVLWSRYL